MTPPNHQYLSQASPEWDNDSPNMKRLTPNPREPATDGKTKTNNAISIGSVNNWSRNDESIVGSSQTVKISNFLKNQGQMSLLPAQIRKNQQIKQLGMLNRDLDEQMENSRVTLQQANQQQQRPIYSDEYVMQTPTKKKVRSGDYQSRYEHDSSDDFVPPSV